MTAAYAIKDWEERFCVSQGKRVVKWSWVALPINPNGEHYRVLMETPEGREAYCVFMGLLGIAANGFPKGVIADRSGPLSVRAIHYRTGIPELVVSKAIEVLSGPEIGWLVPVSLGARSEHARSTLGDEPPLSASERARSTLGARSETHYPTRPNPTQQDITKQDPTAQANADGNGIHLQLNGSGGSGWTPEQMGLALTKCGVNKRTIDRITPYADRFHGFSIVKEFGRLKQTRSVGNPAGALVSLMAKHAGIEMDTRSIVGDLQEVVNRRRAER